MTGEGAAPARVTRSLRRSTARRRRLLLQAATMAATVLWLPAVAAAEPIRIELNAVEAAAPTRCRLTFVVENRGAALESLRLDLATFGKDGGIQRRLVAEMGPVREAKTIVRAFEVENACDTLGAVLVNDVAACAPVSPAECLGRLALAHRGAVRLFK
jgi:hypothetical protein